MRGSKLVIFLAVLAFSVNISAKIIYVDQSAPADGDGISWSSAYISPFDAFRNCYNEDIILIAEGVYHPDNSYYYFSLISKKDIIIMGGFEKGGTWNRDIDAFETIFSGDILKNDGAINLPIIDSDQTRQDNCRTILKVDRCDDIYIEGLTFSDGQCTNSMEGTVFVRNNENEQVIFEKCKFINNWRALYANQGNNSFRKCQFIRNAAPVFLNQSDMRLDSCIFEDNYSDQPGGAIRMLGDCTLDVNDCSFMFNESREEGGTISAGNFCQVKITGSKFSNNISGNGGTVSNLYPKGSLEVRKSIFRDNISQEHSAGIWGYDINIYDTKFIANECIDGSSGHGTQLTIKQGGDANIINCEFTSNPLQYGPVSPIIQHNGNNLKMAGCLFAANKSIGLVVENPDSDVHISNCTWMNNIDRPFAMGDMNGIIENCIFYSLWVPSMPPIYFHNLKPIVRNCNIKNCMPTGSWNDLCGIDGGGNFDSDPSFVDPGTSSGPMTPPDVELTVGDYHLLSQAGRWSGTKWLRDETTSACIDAGSINSDLGDELFPNGGIINLGCYGGTVQASKSYFQGQNQPCQIHLAADINGDCIVNFKDLAFLTKQWLTDNR